MFVVLDVNVIGSVVVVATATSDEPVKLQVFSVIVIGD